MMYGNDYVNKALDLKKKALFRNFEDKPWILIIPFKDRKRIIEILEGFNYSVLERIFKIDGIDSVQISKSEKKMKLIKI